MVIYRGFPCSSVGKESARLFRRPGFKSWVRKIPWRRKWQPTPVILPGKSHGYRSLVNCSPWGRKELGTTERLTLTYLYSVQFSPSVVSKSLWPHGLQHASPLCPSPTLGVYSNSCPLNQWCHPTILSSVVPFSSHLQSFPVSESFPMSQLFTSVAKELEFQLQHQSF